LIAGAQANQKSCVAGIADNVDDRKTVAVCRRDCSVYKTIVSNLDAQFYNLAWRRLRGGCHEKVDCQIGIQTRNDADEVNQ